jgi:hypothetical protein
MFIASSKAKEGLKVSITAGSFLLIPEPLQQLLLTIFQTIAMLFGIVEFVVMTPVFMTFWNFVAAGSTPVIFGGFYES